MRFEFSVAFKYLVPRYKQLSVAIISLVSTVVVAMVVWLVLVFLSVTEGLEKKWVEELVSINAPLRLSPTDTYYQSYYYQIDSLSSEGNYTTKSLGEKLSTEKADPYDVSYDAELPISFPQPDKNEQGEVKDLVKEAWAAVDSLKGKYKGLRAKEYEVSFGTLQLHLSRDQEGSYHHEPSHLSQLSYVASHSLQESNLKHMLVPPSAEDYHHSLKMALRQERIVPETILERFFAFAEVEELRPSSQGYALPYELYPHEGEWAALAVLSSDHRLTKFILPVNKNSHQQLRSSLTNEHTTFIDGTITFEQGVPFFTHLQNEKKEMAVAPIFIPSETLIACTLSKDALKKAERIEDICFTVSIPLQSRHLSGTVYLDNLLFSKVKTIKNTTQIMPLWLCDQDTCIPSPSPIQQGVLIAKHFKKNGVKLGDQGFISYHSPTLHSVQEQKIPIFVAGFYDPGLFPLGSKLIFVEPSVTAQLRSNVNVSDTMLGNGFQIWLDQNDLAENAKQQLQNELERRGIASYWRVDSFSDYEFAKPVLTQLKSDKNLFTLIAIIILLVACSNIISMLILLVNDKKREIAIMQAMGLSSTRIGMIFAICGFMIGFIASMVGIALSIFTLKHLQSLVDFLSFLQGHDAFQAAFYGSKLPNALSISALLFVLIATTIISLIAALVPAIKASKIRPSQLLRSEG